LSWQTGGIWGWSKKIVKKLIMAIFFAFFSILKVVAICVLNILLFKILFITGLCLIIGLERTIKFFFGPQKFKGSLFFFGGIFIVLFGWPLIGMLVEIYGFIALFG
jgi:hypothetical protein